MKHKDVICSDTVVLSLKNHILGASQLGLDLDTHNIMTYTARPKKASCFIRCAFYELYCYTRVCHDSHVASFVSEMCTTDCSPHGVCVGGVCRCAEGWSGTRCEQELCQCGEHGVCRKGKCECHQGWTGENCNIGE